MINYCFYVIEEFMLVGNHIYNLRQQKGLTQKELADQLFISCQLVSKWERHLGEPTTEMILQIIDKYQLPFDYFSKKNRNELLNQEKESIINAFIKSMLDYPDKMPTLEQVSNYSHLSQGKIKEIFSVTDELIYELIIVVDKNIQFEVASQIECDKDIVEIFVFNMAPMLYERRRVLNLLYTRPYVKNIWIKFITTKYTQLLSSHQKVSRENSLDLEYLIGTLTTFISVWLRQPKPETLSTFQNRIIKLLGTDFNRWVN